MKFKKEYAKHMRQELVNNLTLSNGNKLFYNKNRDITIYYDSPTEKFHIFLTYQTVSDLHRKVLGGFRIDFHDLIIYPKK